MSAIRRVGLGGLAMVIAAIVAAPLLADEPDSAQQLREELRQKAAKDKLLRTIGGRLRKTKTVSKAPLSDDDYYLVGLAELTLQTRAAGVTFDVLKGTDMTANKVAGYLQTAPEATARDWQVFARYKTDEEAQDGLLAIRAKYDEYQAYRAELMRLYQAATMVRC